MWKRQRSSTRTLKVSLSSDNVLHKLPVISYSQRSLYNLGSTLLFTTKTVLYLYCNTIVLLKSSFLKAKTSAVLISNCVLFLSSNIMTDTFFKTNRSSFLLITYRRINGPHIAANFIYISAILYMVTFV